MLRKKILEALTKKRQKKKKKIKKRKKKKSNQKGSQWKTKTMKKSVQIPFIFK